MKWLGLMKKTCGIVPCLMENLPPNHIHQQCKRSSNQGQVQVQFGRCFVEPRPFEPVTEVLYQNIVISNVELERMKQLCPRGKIG